MIAGSELTMKERLVEVDVVATAKQKYLALGSCKWSRSADSHVLDRLTEHRDAISGVGDPQLFVFARGFHQTLQRRADDGTQFDQRVSDALMAELTGSPAV